jgi:mono/diheme cytochrome c family protein
MRRLALIVLAAAVAACGKSEPEKGEPTVAPTPAAITFDGSDYKDEATKVAHGKRLSQVLHCNACHGDNMQGRNVSADDPEYGDMNAPNITLLLASYSDEDFDRLLRHGKPKDGREFWFMPVESYQTLGDADLAALIAYLRTLKPEGKQLPPLRRGKGFNEEVAKGMFTNADGQVRRFAAETPEDMGAEHERGRALVRMVCTGCHNSKLQGYEGFTPNLDIAGGFTPAELETLLTTGKGKSKPDLGLMKTIVLDSLSKMSPGERQAVIGYLKARAERPQ